MTRDLLAGLALTLAVATAAGAEVKTRVVDYKQGDTELQGFIAWDDAVTGKRPGVLVVHEWWGHNEHARNAARKLAEAGYVALRARHVRQGQARRAPGGRAGVHDRGDEGPGGGRRAVQRCARRAQEGSARRWHAHRRHRLLLRRRRRAEHGPQWRDLNAVATFHGSLAPHAARQEGRRHGASSSSRRARPTK